MSLNYFIKERPTWSIKCKEYKNNLFGGSEAIKGNLMFFGWNEVHKISAILNIFSFVNFFSPFLDIIAKRVKSTIFPSSKVSKGWLYVTFCQTSFSEAFSPQLIQACTLQLYGKATGHTASVCQIKHHTYMHKLNHTLTNRNKGRFKTRIHFSQNKLIHAVERI